MKSDPIKNFKMLPSSVYSCVFKKDFEMDFLWLSFIHFRYIIKVLHSSTLTILFLKVLLISVAYTDSFFRKTASLMDNFLKNHILNMNIWVAQSNLFVIFIRNQNLQKEFLELRADGQMHFQGREVINIETCNAY